MSRTTVANVIVDGLERAGTPRMFVAPSAALDHELIDAARRRAFPIVTVPGAGVACLMAAVTGELGNAAGAAVVALGPDAVGEAASATAAHAPLLLVTDDGPGGRRHDIAGAVKRSVGLASDSAADGFAEALVLAMTAPRGAVEIRLSRGVAARDASPITAACRPASLPAPDRGPLDAAAHRLASAARPLLVAGRGSRRAESGTWLRALAEALPAPVLVTPSARGTIPDPHPLAFGLVAGRAGATLVAWSDLVVAIGVDAGEIAPSWWPATPAIHLGSERAVSERVRPVVEVVGEVAVILEELAPRLRARQRADWDVAALDRVKRRLAPPANGAAFGPAMVVALAREATAPGTIAVVDTGRWRAAALERWHTAGPLELLMPADPARRGFALPAALAAALCRPGCRVLCLTDAEALARQAAELELAARLTVPVVVVAAGPSRDDVLRTARAGGMLALIAEDPQAFRGALGRACAGARPALIAVPAEPGPV